MDHIYVTVRDMERSEEFYDRAMPVLAFRKRRGTLGEDPPHLLLRSPFVYSPRPSREGTPDHDPYAPGLHHFCFRVVDEEAVDQAASELTEAGVEAMEPRYYPEYGPDYYATFFEDPNRIRLEVTNFRELRRKIKYDWEAMEVRAPGRSYSPRPQHRSNEGPG